MFILLLMTTISVSTSLKCYEGTSQNLDFMELDFCETCFIISVYPAGFPPYHEMSCEKSRLTNEQLKQKEKDIHKLKKDSGESFAIKQCTSNLCNTPIMNKKSAGLMVAVVIVVLLDVLIIIAVIVLIFLGKITADFSKKEEGGEDNANANASKNFFSKTEKLRWKLPTKPTQSSLNQNKNGIEGKPKPAVAEESKERTPMTANVPYGGNDSRMGQGPLTGQVPIAGHDPRMEQGPLTGHGPIGGLEPRMGQGPLTRHGPMMEHSPANQGKAVEEAEGQP